MSGNLGKYVMSEKPHTVTVTVYYTEVELPSGDTIFRVVNDEKAKKMIEEKKGNIEVLNVKFRVPEWESQNEIVSQSSQINDMTGQTTMDWYKYRNMRINKLIEAWDLKIDDEEVPVSEAFLRKMPPDIMTAIYDKFEQTVSIDPLEEGK